MMTAHSISFLAAAIPEAQAIADQLITLHGQVLPEQATVIVAIGGDGFMLQTLHKYQCLSIPVYGVHCGSVGFLMNQAPNLETFLEHLKRAHETTIYPLSMTAYGVDGQVTHELALNEASVFRESSQAAKIRVWIDGVVRLEELICDGVMVATPAGSTAYNFSVHGPILPVGSSLLALTPISPFRPRRWRGALLQDTAQIVFEILEEEKRPVSAAADHTQVRAVRRVEIAQDRSKPYVLLFDPDHNFETRILREQFLD